MLVVGLTGGIGSGKSTAARLFAELGADIIDTDVIAHELTATGQPTVAAIAERFGKECLTAEGALDRPALRQRVFNDKAAKTELEQLLHPLIRQAVRERLLQPTAASYRIVVVPLLFETGAYGDMIQRALVVDSPEELQIERAMARSRLSEAEVRAIMNAQLERQARLARADDVIVNDSDLEKLTKQVNQFHKKYLRLA